MLEQKQPPRNWGTSRFIYISHFLEEIREVAKRFVVLRDGQTAGGGCLDQTDDDAIVALMVGRSVENLFPSVEHAIGPPVLHVERLTGARTPREISFNFAAVKFWIYSV